MSASAIAEAMKNAGCTIDQIVQALKDYEESRKAKGRASNARRQAEFRARRNENNAVIPSNESNGVIPVTGVTDSADPRARVLCVVNSNIKNKTPNGVLQKDRDDEPKPAKRAKSRDRIPPDWQPTEAGIAFALAKGMTGRDTPEQIQKFTDYHTGRGTLAADWDATWRTWCGNFRTFNRHSPRAGPNSGDKVSMLDVFNHIERADEPDYLTPDYSVGGFNDPTNVARIGSGAVRR